MNEEIKRPYDPSSNEELIYSSWHKGRYFEPSADEAERFSIVLPPPNVTGTLHTGHALMLVVEDIIVRFQRMLGKATLWLPGTDHAAIATQSKVEKEISKEKLNKRDLGREAFLTRVDQFAQESHDTIVHQIKKMGASVDWSREAFTLDKKRSLAVRTAFTKMYEDGLIYRGHRIVNWDPKGQTTISDDELVYIEEKTKFYYFKYGPFVIGTARPETKFGDKYVVVHPKDSRYANFKHGDQFELEWINGKIKATIIKDEVIDMEFGTGAMTITPWHSSIDFDIAERHGLDKEQIIDETGKLLPIAGEFAGMKIGEAREKIVEKLKNKGLLVKEEDYTHQVSTAERSGGIIEPQIKLQWFVSVNKKSNIWGKSLKELMIEAVRVDGIKFVPDRYERVYFEWINNLKDWCISRQIWYGHRIPVWYRTDEAYVGTEAPQGEGWLQDEDTLDTWFSSGLWTFSTLGWPERTDDLKRFHPTDLLETGYDIIFFWVARMILMSKYLVGTIPFRTVYLHGLVRDYQGRKMSKSLGNIIDPVDLINKYGADALRMALIVGNPPGNDLNLSEDKVKGYKHFANKIWNASRFVLENTEKGADGAHDPATLIESDREILAEFEAVVKDITNDLENYRLYFAAEKIYHYFWHTFADVIIENCKTRIKEEKDKRSAQILLRHLLEEQLKILHPFMPFVTEKIWGMLPNRKNLLIIEKWPIKI